jgi:hypothetical protein
MSSLRFEMVSSSRLTCPQSNDADNAAKHVWPANLSLCCNDTADISLRANNTNLNSRWLSWIFSPAFDGFHKRCTSHVAFDRFTKSLTSIAACL